MKLTKDQVNHIAKLARIELNPKEAARLQSLLSDTLDYVKILKEVDTKTIEPTSQVAGLENVFRVDKADKMRTFSQSETLVNAPRKKDSYFKIPLVIQK